ncbi:hypothetical protein QFZ76_010121 [Streptomyces sp. V4I2]|nr:hypothetical protein [Streptomyces sp. V4I2]
MLALMSGQTSMTQETPTTVSIAVTSGSMCAETS